MFFVIFSIIVTGGLFVVLGNIVDPNDSRKIIWKRNRKQLFAALGLIITIPAFIGKVPANSVGVVYSPFKGTSEQTLSEGFHIKGIFDKLYKISTEVQTLNITDVTTQTKDAQYVNSTLDIKYRVSASNAYVVFKQYRTLKNMSETLIAPTTQRALELITTKYNVIDILGEARSDVYSELEASLTEEFAKYGVEFYSVSILDMDAGDAIENAITQEAVAKKAVETAEQNLRKAETEAKQQSVMAKAKQDAAKIEAETKIIQAESEKKANDLLNQSLTDEVLQKEWIAKWDGKMPTYYSGDKGAGIMFSAVS